MKNKTQFRQGDVLIERVETHLKQKHKHKRVILAHGEVTGHAHELRDVRGGDIYEHALTVSGDSDDRTALQSMALVVGRDTTVVHQEHAPIPVKEGTHRIIRQREYSPAQIRNVMD